MINISKNKGLTLTELLVSTVLVGIVMVGIASMNYAVKQVQESTNKSAIISLRTAGAMSYIVREGMQAIGDSDSPGIVLDQPTPANCDWVSFRQDINDTAEDYSDDAWKIFIRDLNANTLRMCQQTNAQGGSNPNINTNCSVANSRTISQQIQDVTFELVQDDSTANLDFYLDVSMTTRYTPDSNVHPIDNPEYSLQTKISPIAHSW